MTATQVVSRKAGNIERIAVMKDDVVNQCVVNVFEVCNLIMHLEDEHCGTRDENKEMILRLKEVISTLRPAECEIVNITMDLLREAYIVSRSESIKKSI